MKHNNKTIDKTEQIKAFLTTVAGGNETDWTRVSKKKSYGGEITREFKNKKTGQKVPVSERDDGLLCAHLDDDKLATGRLSLTGAFDKAAQPSAIDRVMNDMFEDRDPNAALLRQAMNEGLAGKFKFYIQINDEDGDYAKASKQEKWERLWAVIYPVTRDETFKCPDYIRPLVPGILAIDECVETEYRFPQKMKIDTPEKLAAEIAKQGLVFDETTQKQVNAKILKSVKDVIKPKPRICIFPKPKK